jgi:methionyl-tRNA formyltransferase
MKYKFNNLKNIVILGYTPLVQNISKINKEFKIKTYIITSPDQKKLLNSNLDFKVFKNINQSFKNYILRNFNIEETLFISFSSRWIFKKNFIIFLKKKIINFHSSRLPFFKGGATFSWQILAEDKIHNQSIHFISEKVDGGDIIDSNISIFPSWCKIPSDYEKYDLLQLENFYLNFIKKIKKKSEFTITPQSKNYGTYFPRIYSKKDGWINWDEESRKIYNFINSMDDPYDGARTTVNRVTVKLKKVEIHKGNSISHSFAAGIVVKKYKQWLEINCSDGYSLLVKEVLDNNNKNYFKKIKMGDRFVTPLSKIFKAKLLRTKFGVSGYSK